MDAGDSECWLPLNETDMKRCKQLSKEYIERDSEWEFAPVLVSTNREKFDITHFQAKKFAMKQGVPLVRW